jgi:hypothetical protein
MCRIFCIYFFEGIDMKKLNLTPKKLVKVVPKKDAAAGTGKRSNCCN